MDLQVKFCKNFHGHLRRNITIEDVSKWVNATGKHQSSLTWFEAWVPDSTFYTKIAKPLMCLRTTSSMTRESCEFTQELSVFERTKKT